MFTLLHSITNLGLFEKHLWSLLATMKNKMVLFPSYCLKLKYPLSFSVSYVQLFTHSMNWELFDKVTTMRNIDDFCFVKEAIMCNCQIIVFHCQQRWMEHKGGYW